MFRRRRATRATPGVIQSTTAPMSGLGTGHPATVHPNNIAGNGTTFAPVGFVSYFHGNRSLKISVASRPSSSSTPYGKSLHISIFMKVHRLVDRQGRIILWEALHLREPLNPSISITSQTIKFFFSVSLNPRFHACKPYLFSF